MDKQLIKIISSIGKISKIEIGGKVFKANIEGNPPSNIFWGHVSGEKDKIIIKVSDELEVRKSIKDIISRFGLPNDKRSFYLIRTLMNLSLPISEENVQVLTSYSLPPIVSSLIIKNSHTRDLRRKLLIAEETFKKINNLDDLSYIINFLISIHEDKSKVIRLIPYDKELFIMYQENSEEQQTKEDSKNLGDITISGKIEKAFVICRISKVSEYRLDIEIFGEVTTPTQNDTEVLKLKLEKLGLKPITLNVKIFKE